MLERNGDCAAVLRQRLREMATPVLSQRLNEMATAVSSQTFERNGDGGLEPMPTKGGRRRTNMFVFAMACAHYERQYGD